MSIGLNSVTVQPSLTPAQGRDPVSARNAPSTGLTRVADVVSTSPHVASTPSSLPTSVHAALDAATGATDTASAFGGVIVAALGQIRRAVVVATDPSVNASQRVVLTSGVQAQVAAIKAAVTGATFGGVNLLDGSASAGASLPATVDGSTSVSLQGADLSPGGAAVTVTGAADLSTPESSRAVLAQVDRSTTAVKTIVGFIDAQGRSLAAKADALGSLPNAGLAGDASSADSAGLLALQLRQQIGAASGSLVGQASQSILSLFRDRAA